MAPLWELSSHTSKSEGGAQVHTIIIFTVSSMFQDETVGHYDPLSWTRRMATTHMTTHYISNDSHSLHKNLTIIIYRAVKLVGLVKLGKVIVAKECWCYIHCLSSAEPAGVRFSMEGIIKKDTLLSVIDRKWHLHPVIITPTSLLELTPV